MNQNIFTLQILLSDEFDFESKISDKIHTQVFAPNIPEVGRLL